MREVVTIAADFLPLLLLILVVLGIVAVVIILLTRLDPQNTQNVSRKSPGRRRTYRHRQRRARLQNRWNILLKLLPEILRNLGVCGRLMQMPTVSPWVKFPLPLLSLLYIFSPIDLMPGLPVDDWLLVLVAFPRLMIHLAPPEAVTAARQEAGRDTYQAVPANVDDDVLQV